MRVITADILQRAAAVLAPRSGQVAVLSVNDTAARFAIPSWMAGKFCAFTMDGSDADIVYGDSSVVCAYGTASVVASQAITADATSGGHLIDKVNRQWIVPGPDTHTHFSVDCKGGGSGKLYIEVSSS